MNIRDITTANGIADLDAISLPDLQKRGGDISKTRRAPSERSECESQFLDSEWKGGARFPHEPSAPRRQPVIFVPSEFSADSYEAAKVGISLARRANGHLVFFHSIHLNLTPYGPANPAWLKAALRQEASEKAEPFMNLAQAAGVRVTCVVDEGVQAHTILKNAEKWKAHIIVLTTRQRGRFARLFRRRTVDQIVREANCPVMVLQKNKITAAPKPCPAK